MGPWKTMFLYQEGVLHFHDCWGEGVYIYIYISLSLYIYLSIYLFNYVYLLSSFRSSLTPTRLCMPGWAQKKFFFHPGVGPGSNGSPPDSATRPTHSP